VLGLIGAGGLGYQILLSLQSLRYEQVWTFLYALIALVGITDALSSWVNRRLNVTRQTEVRAAGAGGAALGTAAVPARPAAGRPNAGRRGFWPAAGVTLAAFLLVAGAFLYSGVNARTLVTERTIRLAGETARGLFPPRLEKGCSSSWPGSASTRWRCRSSRSRSPACSAFSPRSRRRPA
jgi:phosphonate transport system permease protein